MYFAAAFSSCARSASGVSPAASMSFNNGSEILPSGRTTTSADMSLSRQNTIDSTSSGPMTYPAGSVAPPGATGSEAEGRESAAWGPAAGWVCASRAPTPIDRVVAIENTNARRWIELVIELVSEAGQEPAPHAPAATGGTP